MSEEVENVEVSESDKEQNFAKLREKAEALEARLAELEPLAVAQAVREAGFNPNEGYGKALADLAGPGASADTVKEVAAKYGWEPEKPKVELTPNERAAQEFAGRQAALNSVTTPDEPQDFGAQIAEAEQAGDWMRVISLKNQAVMQAGPRS